MNEKQCFTCIYGINRTGSKTNIDCLNHYVRSLRNKPDPYDCEFYDKKTNSYIYDMVKLSDNT